MNILGAMAFLRHATDVTTLLPSAVLSLRTAILLAYAILVVVFVASVSEETRRRLFDRLRPVGTALVPVAIVLVIAQLVNSRFNPIIYFKF